MYFRFLEEVLDKMLLLLVLAWMVAPIPVERTPSVRLVAVFVCRQGVLVSLQSYAHVAR